MAEKSTAHPLPPGETAAMPHALTLEGRRALSVSGVMRVISCDESGVLLQTPLGNLSVGGQGIEVGELSVHTGQVRVTGKIEFLQYSENKESAGGFFSRLFH